MAHGYAREDAAAVFAFLQHVGAIAGGPVAIPPALCPATPLAGSETLNTPVAGVVVYAAEVGQTLQVGDLVAEVIDPIANTSYRVVTGVAGVLYARVRDRYAVAGAEIGKVAGAIPFRTGELLGA